MADIQDKQVQDEETLIQQEFDALLDDYKNSNHRQKLELVTKAFHFARSAHQGLRRRSGEPYIMHPIAVARIVVREIGLGSTSICSALLHDVVEDTDYTVEDIKNLFGPKIAQIVDGLTKISGGVFGDRDSAQAENFRKLLLTMSDDIRVILIKIADRLHNMRTLSSMPPAKQYKIAGETQYIYAPLAHRLGLFRIKTELENLSFKYEHPDTYRQLEERLAVDEEERKIFYRQFSEPIYQKLEELGYQFKLKERLKSVYSIWKKMSVQNVPFEEIYDILALRIIFTPREGLSEKDQCWMLYSAITSLYKPHPERIRDWVSTPKTNGYESLHVTVMGPMGKWVEVQIRSERMDEIAERGLAAHWKYKNGGKRDDESELDKWIKTIKEILENPNPNAIDFMATFKLNLFASEIFVFTPKGEIKTIPQGASVLDFAFLLHSDLGMNCIGAKVNHKLEALSYKLNSGDQIEILTSKKQKPQPEWLDYVVTGRAKTRLEAYFKKEEKILIAEGSRKVEEALTKIGIKSENEQIARLLNYYGLRQPADLYLEVAKGTLSLEDDLQKNVFKPKSKNVFTRYLRNPFSSTSTNEKKSSEVPRKINLKSTMRLDDENIGKEYELASCCNPIPGDDVLGYVDRDEHVIVHKRQCPNALTLKSNFGNRIVSVEWGLNKGHSFVELIEIKGIDKKGVLMEILKIISEGYGFNISEIHISAKAGIFIGKLYVYVHDTEEIDTLCRQISKISEVNSVRRVQNLSDSSVSS